MIADRAAPAGSLRVVSYNVRDLLGNRDAVAHVVRSARPDVLCLQEAPRRPFTALKLRRLARETGLHWITGGRASGGTAILVHRRLSLISAEAHRLPVAGWFTRTRGFALVRLATTGGRRLTVVSVHLPLRPEERAEHARRVVARLRELADAPYVVAGDLNESPDGPSWAQFAELARDVVGQDDAPAAPTYPAREPSTRIDAVLLSDGVRVLSVRVAGAAEGLGLDVMQRASDHLPVIADLVPHTVRESSPNNRTL